MFRTIVITLLSIVAHLRAADVRMPPGVVEGPGTLVRYKTDGDITLPCVVVGVPKPTSEWYINNELLNTNVGRIKPLAGGGIVISQASSQDEGYYQCRVTNQHGVVYSNVSFVQRAVLDSFVGSDVIPVSVNQYDPLRLSCNSPKSVPSATYSWNIAKSVGDESSFLLTTSSRLQVNNITGDLYFANTKPEDNLGGSLYKCNVYNAYLDTTHSGTYTRVTVNTTGSRTFSPTVAFSYMSPNVGLEGKQVQLRCFFNGSPEPTTISWRKLGGTLPTNRYRLEHHNTLLTLSGLIPSDQGDYVCTGSNSVGSRDQTMNLKVEAVPVFNSNPPPGNVNITTGETLSIECNTYSKPTASVEWRKNGVLLKTSSLPPKFKLSSDGTTLNVSNVCKDCSSGSSDLMVIQCNASNVHGYTLGGGYVNVLDPTEITSAGGATTLTPYEQVQLECRATSDDSTTVSRDWYFKDMPIVYNSTLYADNNTGTLHIITADLPHGGAYCIGVYRCVATNQYSEASLEWNLMWPGDVPFPSTASAGLIALYIVIPIVISLLLILLIVLCCLHSRRNRGDTYPVDDKERENGNDPEKELINEGFQDYQRSEVMPNLSAKHHGSLSGSLAKLASDDEASLSQYADFDAGQFNEDGSFIGQGYPSDKRRYNHDNTLNKCEV